MKLTKELALSRGGTIGAPVKRVVKWTDGNTGEMVEADVWVRRLSYHSLIGDAKAIQDQDRDLLVAHRIANSICDEAGQPIFTVNDILGLDDEGDPILDEQGEPRGELTNELAGALYDLVHEVSGLAKKVKTLS